MKNLFFILLFLSTFFSARAQNSAACENKVKGQKPKEVNHRPDTVGYVNGIKTYDEPGFSEFREKIFAEAEYIFKGKVLAKQMVIGKDRFETYCSYLMHCQDWYRGKLETDTFEVVLNTSDMVYCANIELDLWNLHDDYKLHSVVDEKTNRELSLQPGQEFVLFCKANNGKYNTYRDSTTNGISLVPYINSYFCYYYKNHYFLNDPSYSMAIEVKHMAGMGQEFNSYDRFWRYLEERGIKKSEQEPKSPEFIEKETGKKVYHWSDLKDPEHIKKAEAIWERIYIQAHYVQLMTDEREKETWEELNEAEREKIRNEQWREAERRHATGYPLEEYLKKKSTRNTKPAQVESVSCSIANQQLNTGSPDFYEFDVMIAGSSNATYLDNAAFVIQYNPSLVAPNFDGEITITLGPAFNTGFYLDPMNGMSLEPDGDAVRFACSSVFNSPPNRTQVTINEQVLVHVKMEVPNRCLPTDNHLAFGDTDFIPVVYWYTPNPEDPPASNGKQYDQVTFEQPTAINLCEDKPVITSIDFPLFGNQVIAGALGTGTDIITIHGRNFGNERGDASAVSVASADDGGTTRIDSLSSLDYLEWSNTKIVARISSNIYHYKRTNNNPDPEEKGSAGDGYFIVQNSNKVKSDPSNQLMHIPYSFANYLEKTGDLVLIGRRAARIIDPLPNEDDAILFHINNYINERPLMKAAVERALADWSCYTGMHWRLAGVQNPANPHQPYDGINMIAVHQDIRFTEAEHQNAVALTSRGREDFCTSQSNYANGEIPVVYYIDVDIILRENFSGMNNGLNAWFVPQETDYEPPFNTGLAPDEQDFYATLIHELGHAHMLEHVVDENDIMHYSLIQGASANQRKSIKQSGDAINGGLNMMYYSDPNNNNFFDCTGTWAYMPQSFATCPSGYTGCEGDINNDNQVNVDDFLDMLSLIGTTCSFCHQDLDRNGRVNVDDFLLLVGNFGTICN